MKVPEKVWDLAARERGAPITEGVRSFVSFYGRKGLEQTISTGNLTEAARSIASIADRMEEFGLVDSRVVEASREVSDPGFTATGIADERWALWADLRNVVGAGSDWRPLALSRVLDRSAAHLPSERVELSFDSRLSLARLKAELDKTWPLLRKEGWLRQSRPMQKRAAELVRYVCIYSPVEWTWGERCEAWNLLCEAGEMLEPEWRYKDERDMHSEFRRVEVTLTGKRGGLSWFYDPRYRARMADLQSVPSRELVQRYREGDRNARKELEWRKSLLYSDGPALQLLLDGYLDSLARQVQSGQVSVADLPEDLPGFDSREALFASLESRNVTNEGGGLGRVRYAVGDELETMSTEEAVDRFYDLVEGVLALEPSAEEETK